MNAQLFFDLDGTLLDVRRRHLTVYHTLANRMNLPIVSDEIYWERKRNRKFPWDDIPENICQEFRRNFKTESELPENLELDTVYPDLERVLTILYTKYKILIVTQRYSTPNLMDQLSGMAISKLFTKVITPYPGSKEASIRNLGFSDQDMVIGDTEEDIETAARLRISSIAVTWGVRSKEYLESSSPTHFVNTPTDLLEILSSSDS